MWKADGSARPRAVPAQGRPVEQRRSAAPPCGGGHFAGIARPGRLPAAPGRAARGQGLVGMAGSGFTGGVRSGGTVAMKIKRIEHVAIAVRNLDQVRDTFAKLGIGCDHEETLGEHKVRLAMLPIGESAIELLEPQSDTGATAEWLREKGESLWHICLEVDDIEAALAELKGKGVKLRDEVPRNGHGGHRIAFLDPASTAGILVELVEMVGAPHA